MTLVEFLAPVATGKNQDRVLAALYYKERYEGIPALTSEQIRQALKTARAPGHTKVNVADVLLKAGHFVDDAGKDGKKKLWRLTDSGRRRVRDLLGLPAADTEVEQDAGTLATLVARVVDADTKDYLNEALKCLRADALRACVVFVWTAAIRTIHNELLSFGAPALNAALQKHDQKARNVSRIEDFAYIKDSIALLAAKELGRFDKNEKDTLGEALDLRNRCGHPGKYRPGVKKVSSFLEDVLNIVFV